MNDIYENSESEVRTQIAGVIWDKVYNEAHSSHWSGYPGCGNKDDLLNGGSSGMERYVDLLETYAADVIILIHYNDEEAGGCAFTYQQAKSSGYGGLWIREPDNLYAAAHESGHVLGLGHCQGHRVTLDASGVERGGVLPNDLPLVKEFNDNLFVETDFYNPANRGFHTTMSYSSGNNTECVSPGWSSWTHHVHGGIGRYFRFIHHGRLGGEIKWTRTFSNPNISWQDSATSAFFQTGHDTAKYVNKLRYLGDNFDAYRDTSRYNRNSVSLMAEAFDTVVAFKDVPESLEIIQNMSLGRNSVDTQWVYAHFVARNQVKISSGFRITSNASMKISVGESGVLAKRAASKDFRDVVSHSINDGITEYKVAYDHNLESVSITSLKSNEGSANILIHSLSGAIVKSARISLASSKGARVLYKIADLPAGVYIVRLVVGVHNYQRIIAK